MEIHQHRHHLPNMMRISKLSRRSNETVCSSYNNSSELKQSPPIVRGSFGSPAASACSSASSVISCSSLSSGKSSLSSSSSSSHNKCHCCQQHQVKLKRPSSSNCSCCSCKDFTFQTGTKCSSSDQAQHFNHQVGCPQHRCHSSSSSSASSSGSSSSSSKRATKISERLFLSANNSEQDCDSIKIVIVNGSQQSGQTCAEGATSAGPSKKNSYLDRSICDDLERCELNATSALSNGRRKLTQPDSQLGPAPGKSVNCTSSACGASSQRGKSLPINGGRLGPTCRLHRVSGASFDKSAAQVSAGSLCESRSLDRCSGQPGNESQLMKAEHCCALERCTDNGHDAPTRPAGHTGRSALTGGDQQPICKQVRANVHASSNYDGNNNKLADHLHQRRDQARDQSPDDQLMLVRQRITGSADNARALKPSSGISSKQGEPVANDDCAIIDAADQGNKRINNCNSITRISPALNDERDLRANATGAPGGDPTDRTNEAIDIISDDNKDNLSSGGKRNTYNNDKVRSVRVENSVRLKLASLLGVGTDKYEKSDEPVYQRISGDCSPSSPQPKQLRLDQMRPDLPAKRLISRSGSQCSSVSSGSTYTSSVSTSSSQHSSASSCNSTGLGRLDRSRIVEEEREFDRLSLRSGDYADDNNNNEECRSAYDADNDEPAKDCSSSLDEPRQQVAVPPPPPPPPPMPTGNLSTLGYPMDLKQIIWQHRLRASAVSEIDSTGNLNDRANQGSGGVIPKKNSVLLHGAAALPAFIPPQFSAPPKDGTNIKPSEYLKRISSNSALATDTGSSSPATINSKSPATCELSGGATSSSSTSTPISSLSSSTGSSLIARKFERPANYNLGDSRYGRAALRRPIGELTRSQSTSALGRIDSPDSDSVSNYSSSTDSQTNETELSAEDQTISSRGVDFNANLMSAIRERSKIFNRNKHATETNDEVADPVQKQAIKDETKLNNMLAATKRDLIAELKESKGLDGINRMKDGARNREQIKKMIAAMMPSFKADDFLDKVAESEPGAPLWRRQMLAKKAADRARKECEEKARQELEERRLSQVPAWKRQMLAKKAAERCKRDDLDKVRRESEDRRLSEMPVWRRQLVRVKLTASIDNISTVGQRSN